MRRQVVVAGLGRFGASLAKVLFGMGHDVLAMDIDEKKVQSMAPEITHAVAADATDEAVLKELGVGNFDVAVVAMGSAIQSSVLSTILLKRLGVRYVIARAENELHGAILEKIGADKVIYPERDMGIRVAHELTLTDVSDYISLTSDYGVARVEALPSFVGRTLSELELGRGGKWEVAVLVIQHEKEFVVTPDRAEPVKSGDVLIVAGKDEKIQQWLTESKKEQATSGE